VLRYDKRQYYSAHHDFGGTDADLACGPRILTFFLYLSDVEEGGETSFPQLNIGLSSCLLIMHALTDASFCHRHRHRHRLFV
jgi:hypothetical protein